MYKAVAFFLVSLFLVSCSKKDAINIAGSSTVLPVISNASEEFRKIHPDINIIVNSGGSGVGINQLGEGKIEIGMASRDLTDEEMKKYPKVKFIIHAVGRDAVVPVVSSEIHQAGVQTLTLEQIGKIYTGEITNWKEVGGLDRDILVIDKEKSRGTRHVFMEILLGNKVAEAPGADLVLGSNNEEQTALVQSDAAIGMLSHAWLNDDVKGLAVIMEDHSIIAPTMENIVNGRFPFSRDLLLVTNGEPQQNTKAFIDFILSPEGQEVVEAAGYVKIKQ